MIECPACGLALLDLTPKQPLTKRQKEVYDVVRAYIHTNGYAPTHDELRKMLSVAAISTVNELIGNLVTKGWLRRAGINQARAIELV